MSIETIAPILDSTQPAFDVGRYQNLYPIYFKYPPNFLFNPT